MEAVLYLEHQYHFHDQKCMIMAFCFHKYKSCRGNKNNCFSESEKEHSFCLWLLVKMIYNLQNGSIKTLTCKYKKLLLFIQ